jgi:hypothetical protein
MMRIPNTVLCSIVLAGGGLLTGAHTAYSLQQAEPATVPPLVLEDFEGTTLGSRPYLWKEEKKNASEATIGAERTELDGNDANKALKFEYEFGASFNAAHNVEVGPGLRGVSTGQDLPGSLTGVALMIYGDNSKNSLGLRVKDRTGESFTWQLPITWSGWKKAVVPIDPRLATKGGTRGNGALDPPLTFEAITVQRQQAGARKGEVMVDNLEAQCKFAKVATLLDSVGPVNPVGWKASRNRAQVGEITDTLRPRGGKDVPVLTFQYKYENSGDASVEFAKTISAGDGHGTLILDVFGDGSNNVLRVRMLDGQDHVWQATWATILVDWAGWRSVYVDTRTLRDTAGNDPTAMLDKFPVKFHSVVVDDCSPKDNLPGVESGREGDICIGRILYCAEK